MVKDEIDKRCGFLIKSEISSRARRFLPYLACARFAGPRKNGVLRGYKCRAAIESRPREPPGVPRRRRGYRGREGFVSRRYGFHCLRGTCSRAQPSSRIIRRYQHIPRGLENLPCDPEIGRARGVSLISSPLDSNKTPFPPAPFPAAREDPFFIRQLERERRSTTLD